MDKHSHYFKDVSHLDYIDIYRILELYKVTDQAVGHAIKKLLCAGERGEKDQEQDYQEAIDTLMRRKEMIAEDEKKELLFGKSVEFQVGDPLIINGVRHEIIGRNPCTSQT